MRFVVTGASGFIGNNLIRYINAVDPTATVVALCRRPIGRELVGANYVEVVGDLFSEEFLNENINSGDVVVHSAGLIDLTDKLKDESFKVNVDLTKLICDVSAKKHVKKFVYVGSVDGIYKEGDGKVEEPTEFFPDKIEGNYGKTKAFAMLYVNYVINSDPDFNGCIVAPSAVIGANDYKPSAVGEIIRGVLQGKKEIGIKGGYNFVDVKDVAKCIYALSVSTKRGLYILSGENRTIKEVFTELNGITGKDVKPVIVPTVLAKICLPFIKNLNKITLKALNEPHNYSNEKVKTELGVDFTP
ncbi:MAG: NAD-dependent epimerase/dehydratase family protein, partial [Clostridia bacterium]|nr:NAD-dependent epimerase/dehydratase family protein [Clostridia bacterium]